MTGTTSIEWNKNKPGYKSVHKWLRIHYGRADHCSNCETPSKSFEWANLSGEYLRNINDYIQLCTSCHRKMDYTEQQRINRSIARKGLPMTKLRKPVVQRNLDDSIITVYASAHEAYDKTGVSVSRILSAINGGQKTSGGFKWTR